MGIFQKLTTLLTGGDNFAPPLPADRRISNEGISAGSYEICIPQGLPRTSGHILIGHRQQYTIVLRNRSSLRCDARVLVDGKEVGCWRIAGNSQIEVERPVNDTGRFTFYMLGSNEARRAGLSASDALGLVTATFMPELPPQPVHEGDRAQYSQPRRGGTGLSGQSNQAFKTVEALNYDRGGFVTIDVRLYCDDDAPRELKAVGRSVPSPLP
jgi:hypothetical protein